MLTLLVVIGGALAIMLIARLRNRRRDQTTCRARRSKRDVGTSEWVPYIGADGDMSDCGGFDSDGGCDGGGD